MHLTFACQSFAKPLTLQTTCSQCSCPNNHLVSHIPRCQGLSTFCVSKEMFAMQKMFLFSFDKQMLMRACFWTCDLPDIEKRAFQHNDSAFRHQRWQMILQIQCCQREAHARLKVLECHCSAFLLKQMFLKAA